MARKSRKQLLSKEPAEVFAVENDDKKKGVPTAAYIRLSMENSGNETDDTLRTQIMLVETYIKEHEDLELVETYVDNGFSGTKFDRPEFAKMMEAVKRGDVQCIVVKDLSRFGRDYLETGYYLEHIFPLLNVRFIAITDDYDNSRPEDLNSLAIPLKNMVNAMYAKDYSRKQEAFRLMCQKAGRVMGNYAAYGYKFDRENERLVKDPEVEPYVHMIFAWLRAGVSKADIANRLNLIGAPTPAAHDNWDHGFVWKVDTIVNMYRNPVYAGFHVMGKKKVSIYRNIAQHTVDRKEWLFFPDFHEPYISMEDYEQICQVLADNKKMMEDRLKVRAEDRKKMPDCFPGKVYCADCGRRMGFYRGTHHKGYENLCFCYYRCKYSKEFAKCSNKKITQNFLKIVVMEQITNLIRLAFDRDEFIRKSGVNEQKSRYANKTKTIARIRMKLQSLEERYGKAYMDSVEGLIDPEDYQIIKSKMQEERRQLEAELEKEEQLLKKMDQAIRNLKIFLDCYGDMKNAIEFNQNLVDELVRKIYVSDDGAVSIEFNCKDIFDNEGMAELTADMEVQG